MSESLEKAVWKTCYEHVREWFKYKNKGEWLKDMQNGLSMTASIIATMTFQLASNPPGGVVQASFDDKGLKICKNINGSVTGTTILGCPGESVMAVEYPEDYRQFLIWNTLSFVASISVCLMLVSGIPLNHRFPTWLLSIGMVVAVTALGVTYLKATYMVTPDSLWVTYDNMYYIGLGIWLSLLGIVALFLIIRIFVWGVSTYTTPKRSVNNRT